MIQVPSNNNKTVPQVIHHGHGELVKIRHEKHQDS